MSGWGRNSFDSVACLKNDTGKHFIVEAMDTAACQTVQGDIYAFAIPKTLLTLEEIDLSTL